MLEVTWNSEDLEVWRGGKTEKALARAVRRAGNEALKTAQGSSEGHVLRRKLAERERVRQGLPLTEPSRNAELESMVWVERMEGRPMGLARFPHILTREGARVRVNASGGWHLLRSAFGARMGSGHFGIFRREGKARYPIHELWTSSIANVMGDDGALATVSEEAVSKFDKAFARAMSREIKAMKRRAD